jgi:hypothetical protein
MSGMSEVSVRLKLFRLVHRIIEMLFSDPDIPSRLLAETLTFSIFYVVHEACLELGRM